MNITVVGLGYVGIANTLLLAQNNTVTGVDINQERVQLLKTKHSPLHDSDIRDSLRTTSASWTTSFDSVKSSELLIVSTPTDYDENTGKFNTSSIETVIQNALTINPSIYILIKSTIPIGYVEALRQQYNTDKIAFSPEFLREGSALRDNLYPSRIIIGDRSEWAVKVANLFRSAALNEPEVIMTGPSEAESIKLFSNTYLAMRVAYFNELDTFCIANGLDAKDVVLGTSLDPRIGNYYNNPSFGYGGYCFPKDTKQLLASYAEIPNELIGAIVRSNDTRKKYLVTDILNKKPKIVGVYRLAMKAGSDNFRMSAITDIMNLLQQSGVEIVIYEPELRETAFNGCRVISKLESFLAKSDLILANRSDDILVTDLKKVYTRDIFHVN